jgi:hypothetical protein
MNAPIDFPEESMTMPQNCFDIWFHIVSFFSPAIYERKKSSNDQPSKSAQSARRKCFVETPVHERRIEMKFGRWIEYYIFNVANNSDSNPVKGRRRRMNSQRRKWTSDSGHMSIASPVTSPDWPLRRLRHVIWP